MIASFRLRPREGGWRGAAGRTRGAAARGRTPGVRRVARGPDAPPGRLSPFVRGRRHRVSASQAESGAQRGHKLRPPRRRAGRPSGGAAPEAGEGCEALVRGEAALSAWPRQTGAGRWVGRGPAGPAHAPNPPRFSPFHFSSAKRRTNACAVSSGAEREEAFSPGRGPRSEAPAPIGDAPVVHCASHHMTAQVFQCSPAPRSDGV